MKRYEFDEITKTTLEKLRVPLAVYQFVNKRVVTILLSDGFCAMLGVEDREKAIYMMDHDMYEATHPDDKARVADEALRFATEGGRYDVVYRTRLGGSGDYRILHAIGEHVTTADGTRLAYIWYTDEGAYSAETDNRQFSLSYALRRALHEESAVSAVNFDALTGLPSMTFFFDLVNQWRRENKGAKRDVAVVYLNLCGMKTYNRRFGFAVGDNLLRRFAGILNKYFGQENCSRFGSDHFCVFTHEEDLEDILNSIFIEFKSDAAGPTLPVRAGIYSEAYGVLGISAECDRAKYACDALRDSSKSAFMYYDNNMLLQAGKRHFYIDNLSKAIRENRIKVYYQPLVRSANGTVCNEEALVRWLDPERGIISPAEFIPVLEEAKSIYKLDLCVVEQVLEKIKAQEGEGLYIVPISVNISRADFDACDIVEEIRRRVDEAGVSRSKLVIELTESSVGKDFEYMKTQIGRFRELGFPVWMDDFGSGYSSLDLMQSIQFDLVKFDMRFMKQFRDGDKSRIMLTELIRMAIFLGMDTVCEGVESREQADFLREVGCTMMQGYYFCRPIPMNAIFDRYRQGVQIGFENPDERDYYAAIGKINLYDLAFLSNDDSEAFENYFNTVPMAIIESTADHFRLMRCNSSYRAFVTKLLGYYPLGRDVSFEKGDGITSRAFLNAIRECAESNGKQLIEDKLPDGTVMQTFLKYIADNPVAGTKAVAIAVLAVTQADKNPVTFTYIAKALSSDYISLYYVNCQTGEFIEYSSNSDLGELAVERYGENFFEASHHDAQPALYHEDLEMFREAFTKEKILRAIDDEGAFTLSFRLMIGGEPSDVMMKAVRVKTDEDHIIIGLTKKNKPKENTTGPRREPFAGGDA